MTIYEFLSYFILVLIIVCPILWQISQQFRYLIKITSLYMCVLMTTFIGFFAILPTPFDPNNHKRVFQVFKALTTWTDLKWHVRGKKNLEFDGPCIVVLNHQSSLDLHGFLDFWPDRGVIMAKKSLQYAGFLGVAAKLSRSVFIDRFNADKARSTLDKSLKAVCDDKLKLVIFPEGTRNHEEGMLPFKKGAFHLAIQAQLPIVPVVYSSYKAFYSKKEWKWLSGGQVIIEVLPQIETKGMTRDDVTRLSELTRDKMLESFERISTEALQKFNETSKK